MVTFAFFVNTYNFMLLKETYEAEFESLIFWQ